MEETYNIEKYFTSEDKQSILRQSNVVYIKQIKKARNKNKRTQCKTFQRRYERLQTFNRKPKPSD